MLTAPQMRALTVLREHPEGINPGYFGALMYPNTTGHVNAAQGLAPYAARSQAAGSVLARLHRKGWTVVSDRGRYSLHRISAAGQAALDAAGDS